MKRLRPVLLGAAVLFVLAGCEGIFSTSLFSWARRTDKTLDQRVNDAKAALASGDTDEIADVYADIKDAAAASTDGDLQLLAGQLALELSGINDAFDDLMNIDFASPLADNIAYINGLVAQLTASYVGEAAGFYQQAAGNSGDLDATDYLLGALAMVAEATADPLQGAGNVDNLSSTDPGIVNALAFLAAALPTVPPDSPSYEILSDFNDFLGTSNFP